MALALWLAGPALATALEDGLEASGQGNFAVALRLLKPLADRGNASAQYEIGWMHYGGWGVPKDVRQAAQWYRKAAGQGDADAQLNLGLMYQNGQGVPKNDAEAARWLRKAADQGVAVAQFQIGWMYDNGQGVPQSNAEAMLWYRKAADQRGVAAQFNLGLMYQNGQGVPQDYAEAVRWYRKAAEQGDAAAQVNLGVSYRDGRGVPKDYVEAVRWFRKAANQEKASALDALGGMYHFGEGVPKDEVLAYMWDNLAAARGSSTGAKSRDLDAARMTPDQIAEAQRLSRECQNHLLNLEDCDDLVPMFLVPDQAQIEVSLVKERGTFKVPVLINGVIPLNFTVDSGAADVSIPADVVMVMMRTGTLQDGDFLGTKTYRLADGSTVPARTFRIKTLKVGDSVVENVVGSVASVEGSLLLGQSFLGRFHRWSINNGKQVLELE